MRRILAILLATTLAAAIPVVAQTAGTGSPCGAEASGIVPDCCPNTAAATGCQATGCAGWGAALVIASSDRRLAPRISDSPESFLARLNAPPARAPDTAPPKPAV
jgi:hypothetical protein